jgi:major type 1 subunit fimbrin (pilin)
MKLLTRKASLKVGSSSRKTILFAAMAISSGTVVLTPIAFASDGTITFKGSIVDTTCSVKGPGTSATGSFTVTLPNIAAGALPKGATAGNTAFSLTLSGAAPVAAVGANPGTPGCTDGKVASMNVENVDASSIDSATGNLINTGTAANVQIRLAKQDGTAINLASNDITATATGGTTNNQPTATITKNAATLNYVAQYYAKDKAGAGTVNAQLVYSINYN